MFKYLVVSGLLASLPLNAIPISAAVAQTSPIQRGALLDTIQLSVSKAIAAQEKTVEISIGDNILTALRVNSNQNDTSHAGRNNEAVAIAKIVSAAIANRPEYADITTIRVQYLSRDSATADAKVIDTVDFRKNPTGIFEIHLT
jgi:hypothetical protein